MAERLLLLPEHWISPETLDNLLGPATALVRILREHAEVDVFRWPSVHGGPTAPPTWQASVELVREALTPGCHVLASPGSVSLALLALSEPDAAARSFIALEFAIPDRTLEVLGISGIAAVSAAGYRTQDVRTLVVSEVQLGEWALPRSDGITGSPNEQAAALAGDVLDYSYLDDYLRSWESLDLLAESPHLSLPCLLVEPVPEVSQFPEGEAIDLFLRFVPTAQVRRTEIWGLRHRRPGGGEEVGHIVVEFLDSLRASSRLLTVLVTDIVDSTVQALEMGDQRWARMLADHHAIVRRQLKAHGGNEVDNAGDGFLATFESPARAVRCAAAIVEGVRPLGIEVRAGVHVGECEVMGEKVGGVAVHAGARVATSAGPGEVLVSQSVRDLVAGSDLQFDSGRTLTLRGLPGEWQLYPLATE
ncbi:MAG TPA: adenylate/guanylate cyclase domain-containing protein [Dehalococcoidia bacterium]|nr:adenylate/guanylate cyclase domain-containing protein [Dehalococcoidia bacterium]